MSAHLRQRGASSDDGWVSGEQAAAQAQVDEYDAKLAELEAQRPFLDIFKEQSEALSKSLDRACRLGLGGATRIRPPLRLAPAADEELTFRCECRSHGSFRASRRSSYPGQLGEERVEGKGAPKVAG